MPRRAHIRPSKLVSAVTVPVGVFVVIGMVVFFPGGGLIGAFCIVVGVGLTLYHLHNLLFDRGVSVYDIEIDDQGQSSSSEPPEQRLEKLDQLCRDGHISQSEYAEQRQRLLDQL